MRLIRITGWLLLTTTVLLAGAVGVMLGTESGLQWTVKQLKTATNGKLKIETAQGRLLDNIRLQEVRYRDQSIALSADEIIIRWHPGSLLQGLLQISTLEAGKLHITQLKKMSNKHLSKASLFH